MLRRFTRARRPARSSAPSAGKRARQLKPLPPPSFELVQTWLSAPPRPSGPGTPRRRFPPSSASAPSRPPAGSRHPTLPASRPPPGLRAPEAPRPLPERRRVFSIRTKSRRRASTRQPLPSAAARARAAGPARRSPAGATAWGWLSASAPGGLCDWTGARSCPANRGGAWLDWGGQIKAMAIGLPGLALGPGAFDTHWDAEGGGAPAAAAAAALGSGARERRGLGLGAQVTRRCRGGPPTGLWSRARGGGAAGTSPPALCPSGYRPQQALPGRRFCRRGEGTPLGRGTWVWAGPRHPAVVGGQCGTPKTPGGGRGGRPRGACGGVLSRARSSGGAGLGRGRSGVRGGLAARAQVSFVWSAGWDGTHTSWWDLAAAG